MNNLRYIFLFSFLYGNLFGQNLIPNPSFEDVNVCQKYNEPCSPKAWRSTLLKGFVYGEYLGEKKSKSHDPIIPPDGNRYISLRMFNKGKANDRTFVQVPLLCPLEKGQDYQISFQFYSPVYHIEHIGMTFTNEMKIHKNNKAILELDPSILFPIDFKLKHRTWQTAVVNYIATGEEVGLILGNFQSDEQTKIKALFKTKRNDRLPNRVYYIFDDFRMVAVSNDALEACDSDAYLSFLYQDTTRHIPHRRIVTIEDYPVFPEITIATNEVDTLSEKITTSNPILIGNDIVRTEEEFVIEDITFETNSAVLKAEAYPSIDQIISYLSTQSDCSIVITGHTDNVGTTAFNLELSKARAQTIAQLLMNAGINAYRISSYGKGESEPLTENKTENGRAKNRRVTFRLLQE